jgi:hypothetical protein
MNALSFIYAQSGRPASTTSLMLSDGKHESKKSCSRSKTYVHRQAWVLQSGDLFLQALEGATIQWTANQVEAMSWLDPDLAMERLQMIASLSKYLADSRLVLTSFTAQIGQHPLQWECHD